MLAPNRAGFALATVLILLISLLAVGQRRDNGQNRANLLVITIDTLRADHLECYGRKSIKTPRINALAADGILIENAYTPIPLTLPSHASIFTGTYPVFHGVRDFTGFTLPKERTTLATMLKSAGYRTGAVVASAVLESRWGLNQGFDFYYDNFPAPRDQNWQQIAERRGDEVVRESLRWLEKNKSGPFFLWVHFFDPHDPYTPPPPYDRQYSACPYDGEIAYTDENVGRILDAFKQNGLYDDCMIVLMGDHGEGLGEHGEKTHGFFIYDSTLRIPLIFKLPGASAPRNRRLRGPMRTIDVVPTVLQALGLAGRVRASEVQGKGAYSALLGKSPLPEVMSQAEIMLPYYHFDYSPLTSIRLGRLKYIEAPRPELYDTEADPAESRNLSADQRAMAARLKDLLRQDIARYSPRNSVPPVPRSVDTATMEKLASLGYLALSKGTPGPAAGSRLPDPKDKIDVYQLIFDGTYAARNGKYDEAANLLTRAAQREPGSLIAHFQLGVVHSVTGSLDEAEKEFLKTLQLRPGYDLALKRLADVHIAEKRYKEAEATYQKLIAQSPSDYMVYFNLGGLYVTLDRWDDALSAFRKAQTLNHEDILIPMVISRILLKKGDFESALAAVAQALRLDPNLVSAHETALEIYQRQGRASDAAREAETLRRLRPRP
ncbi:MAG TPA: sulfatase-like hydrolase/transferase [Acidobacteriota bacterium]|nr:sulfatase-like hydrolase/transferase [Acidobacteriota bacterium]